eukprot:IDg17992t1
MLTVSGRRSAKSQILDLLETARRTHDTHIARKRPMTQHVASLMQCIESCTLRNEFLERHCRREKARTAFKDSVRQIQATHMDFARVFNITANTIMAQTLNLLGDPDLNDEGDLTVMVPPDAPGEMRNTVDLDDQVVSDDYIIVKTADDDAVYLGNVIPPPMIADTAPTFPKSMESDEYIDVEDVYDLEYIQLGTARPHRASQIANLLSSPIASSHQVPIRAISLLRNQPAQPLRAPFFGGEMGTTPEDLSSDLGVVFSTRISSDKSLASHTSLKYVCARAASLGVPISVPTRITWASYCEFAVTCECASSPLISSSNGTPRACSTSVSCTGLRS